MMDFGLGEFPLPAHLAARQVAAVRQLGHLLGRQVEVAGQSITLKFLLYGIVLWSLARAGFVKWAGESNSP